MKYTGSLRTFFKTQKTKNLFFKKQQLLNLKAELQKNEEKILEALQVDLGKHHYEGYITELMLVYQEINHALKHLKDYHGRKSISTPFTIFGSKSYIYYEPYGVVLIISPWNYPISLSLNPLIGAIATGNCAILKPSEYAPTTAKILQKIIENSLHPDFVKTVCGDYKIAQEILQEKFDYIFFTGSTQVGKIIMQEAAKYLTPTTLELGGKNPCIIHKDAKISSAAKKITWAKFMNAGQTCIAPDFLLLHSYIQDEFIEAIKQNLKIFFGENPIKSKNFGKIINLNHFNRLQKLIQEKIIIGGTSDQEKLKIEPTVILLDSANYHQAPIMQEEIFGPLLPIITYQTNEELWNILENFQKSLALYIYTEDKKFSEKILQSQSFGGGCINDCITQVVNPNLPFGGIGESGMGRYHGKYTLETFLHQKSIIKASSVLDTPLRYPPYKNNLNFLRWLSKFL